jgi:uncharacterized iron-regulated membrane protein
VQPGPHALTAAEVIGAATTAYPKLKFRYLVMPPGPDRSYYAMMMGDSGLSEVFVDGYTGKILGTRSLPTVLGQIHSMHLTLLIPGGTGSNIVFGSSLLLIWLIASGLYLWWPLKRATVKWSASLRRVAFDLHSAVGIYTFFFLFVLALTGAFVHFDNALESGLNKMAHVSDPLRGAPSTVAPGAKPIGPDEALAIAAAALPGTKPNILMPPAGPKGSYRVNIYFPEDETGNRSWVLIDQYSGKPLYVESSRTAPFGNKLVLENRAIHTGQLYGYPTKVLMSLSSLMVVVTVITGYYMWWKKLRWSARKSRAPVGEREMTPS